MIQYMLDQIRCIAELEPEREAVVTKDGVVSYRTLQQLIEQTADELRTLAVQRLGIKAGNSVAWMVVDLAAASCGIPVVPVPLFFSSQQIQHLLNDSRIDTVFCDHGDLKWLDNASTMSSSAVDGWYQMLTQLRSGSHDQGRFSKVTYTSGSTGNPKGVCLSADALQSTTLAVAEALQQSQLHRHLSLIPFATLLENVAGVYVALTMGRSLVIADVHELGLNSNHSFDASVFADAINTYQVESVILLPQMLKEIVEQGHISKLASLRFIAVGGGKVAPQLLQRCQQLQLPVYEGYGLSECGSVVSLNTPGAFRIGSVGKPLGHVDVVISDSGEVIVRGSAMQGYLHDADIAGDIATGDAGFIDEDGYLFITGRIKNTLVSSFGRNISPEWVESCFMAEPAVQQIAVFGEAQPCLSAVIHTVADTSAQALEKVIARVNQQLPDYARVQRWHCSEQPFTAANGLLTANGKLCRQAIAQRFETFINDPEGIV